MNQSEWIRKPASLWVLQDLEQLAQAEEGPYLEFKKPSEFIIDGKFSWDHFSSEVAETMSAFLNADGGVLLVGVQTDQGTENRNTEFLRSLSNWTATQTFEHLKVSITAPQVRDRIYGNILPKPFGIEVQALDVPVGSGNTAVFVVTVPASALGAHQSVRTYRYYRRTTDGDRPMLDYEIRDANNRKAGPLLHLNIYVTVSDGEAIKYSSDGEASYVAAKQSTAGDNIPYFPVWLLLTAQNFGRGTALVARFDVGLPENWTLYDFGGWFRN